MSEYILINNMLSLIPNEDGWDEYLAMLYKNKLGGKAKHFGIPVEFPCLVTSYYSPDNLYLEHRFVYCRDVKKLLEEKSKHLGRLRFLE